MFDIKKGHIMNTGNSTKRLIEVRQKQIIDLTSRVELYSSEQQKRDALEYIEDLKTSVSMLQGMLNRHLNNRKWLARGNA